MVRIRYEEQLNILNKKLIEMGSLIEDTIQSATKGLCEKNKELAIKAIKMDAEIDNLEKEIETLCLKLLLHQQPVAKDLRLISTALKMITDMERIGDQAADISEIALLLMDAKYIKKLEHIPQMADISVKMVTQAIDAFVKRDIELANAVIKLDDKVDELFLTVKKDLIYLVHSDVNNGEQAFDLLMIAKYLERIGDHATNIAEWVVFSITGTHKDTRIM